MVQGLAEHALKVHRPGQSRSDGVDACQVLTALHQLPPHGLGLCDVPQDALDHLATVRRNHVGAQVDRYVLPVLAYQSDIAGRPGARQNGSLKSLHGAAAVLHRKKLTEIHREELTSWVPSQPLRSAVGLEQAAVGRADGHEGVVSTFDELPVAILQAGQRRLSGSDLTPKSSGPRQEGARRQKHPNEEGQPGPNQSTGGRASRLLDRRPEPARFEASQLAPLLEDGQRSVQNRQEGSQVLRERCGVAEGSHFGPDDKSLLSLVLLQQVADRLDIAQESCRLTLPDGSEPLGGSRDREGNGSRALQFIQSRPRPADRHDLAPEGGQRELALAFCGEGEVQGARQIGLGDEESLDLRLRAHEAEGGIRPALEDET